MIALLLAVLSFGIQAERSSGLSEPGTPVGITLRVTPEDWRITTSISNANKDQGRDTPCCWRSSLTVDRESGPMVLGAGWTHRDAGSWTKDRAWLRGGLRWENSRIIVRSALTSRDRETAIEVSTELPVRRLVVEPSWGWVLFDQGSTENRRWASIVSLRVMFR